MRPSEVFLRLASALVAWMFIYAYFLWLAVLHEIGCGPDSDEIFRLFLGMAPLAMAAATLLRVTRSFLDIHSILRWLAVPLAIMLPFVLKNVWAIAQTVNFEGHAICDQATVYGWHVYWSPIQLFAVGFCAWMALRVWRSVRADQI